MVFAIDGQQVKTQTVSVTVSAEGPLWVAAMDLERGHVVRSEDLERVVQPYDDLPHDALLDPDTIVGKEVRSSIGAGKPFKASSLDNPTLVTRGERVTIVYYSGSLVLSAPGEALKSGSLGESVRVENLATNMVHEGKVVQRNVVEIR